MVLCLLSAAIAGCAAQSRLIQTEPLGDLPRRVELTDTPFFAQEDYHCGPAALATALSAAGIPTPPDVLVGEVYLPGRKGTLQLEMLAGARRRGAVATVIPARLEALMRETAAGHPVVVLQNLGLSWAPSWHYAVVIGYDLDAGHVLLRSGPIRRQALALRTFEHTWARGGYWAFVALPPGRLPATAEEAEATRALVAFERSAKPGAAVQAYAAALERWPDSLTLAIGLGNAQYAAGDLAAAEQAFRDAAQRHEAAPAYNNLAVVLLERGNCETARAAALHAVALGGPLYGAARDTLRLIDSSDGDTDGC
jgi:predicted double-glycine peptidase